MDPNATEVFRREIDQSYIAPRWPLEVDSYVARSILQKAIRRGHIDLALAAASTLLEVDPTIFWRRMIVVILEDLGVANIELLARTVASSRKSFRADLGNHWQIAANLVTRACEATKCQAANDLYNIAINEPETAAQRALSAKMPSGQLLYIAADQQLGVVQRAAAALAYLGEGFSAGTCGGDATSVARLFDALALPMNREIADIYLQAFRATRLALAPLSLILLGHDGDQEGDGQPHHDHLAADTIEWIGGAPAFALDQYTRPGRATINLYVDRSRAWVAFAEANDLARKTQLIVAGELLFRVEGAVLDRRRNWQLGNTIGRRSRRVGCYLPATLVDAGIKIIADDLRLINCIRKQVYRSPSNGIIA